MIGSRVLPLGWQSSAFDRLTLPFASFKLRLQTAVAGRPMRLSSHLFLSRDNPNPDVPQFGVSSHGMVNTIFSDSRCGSADYWPTASMNAISQRRVLQLSNAPGEDARKATTQLAGCLVMSATGEKATAPCNPHAGRSNYGDFSGLSSRPWQLLHT